MQEVHQPNLSGGLFAQILGGFYMLAGGLYCLTCFGALFGVPWFLLGLALFRGGQHAKAYQSSGDAVDGLRAADELMRFVRIQVILAAVGFAVGLIGMLFYAVMIGIVVMTGM